MTHSTEHHTRHSVCPLDCPDTCSLNVTVKGDHIVEVRGSKANPFTAGTICNKVARNYPEFVHGTERLVTPLQRTGQRGSGSFEPISWDVAIDRIHEGFSRAIDSHGPQSVMPFNYAGPHGELAGGSMDRRFFYQLGATLLNRGPLCGSVRGTAYTSLFGNAPGMPPEQAQHADLIVVWGNNVTVSNLHMARVVKKARERGARLIVIDPKRTKIADQAHLHLPIHPGTDVILAMAVAAELEYRNALDSAFFQRWTVGFDRYMAQARQYTPADVVQHCGLPRALFDRFVSHYESATCVAVSIGNGIERGRSGGSGLRAAMALQALTGNMGRLGAGVLAKPGFAFPKTTDKLQRPDLIPAGTRTFNIVDVPQKLLDASLSPPIKALMIYNHNPLCTHPNQNAMRKALSRPDLFIAGSDVVMTDSMRYADIILPATTHFEQSDVYGAYGHHYIQRAEAVIGPVGESLPNTEIFRRLAARFGFDDALFKDSDVALMDAAFDGTDSRMQGFRPSDIPLDKALEMTTADGSEAIMCDTVQPQTPSGKIELFSEDLEQRFGYGVPRFEPVEQSAPFVLITPSSENRTNATFGGCSASQGLEILEISPVDADAQGIEQDAVVSIWNELGTVTLKASITDKVRPGVLYSPKGTWLHTSDTGNTVNALIPATIRTDIEDGACYNETFVNVACCE